MAIPLFKLPLLVITLLLETMGFIEIFVLTRASSRTKRIVKDLVKIRNYKMLMFVTKGEIVFDFRSDQYPGIRFRLLPKENQPDDDVFLLKIGSSENVPSKVSTLYGRLNLRIFWGTSIINGTELYIALLEVFKVPLDEISMKLDGVTSATISSWIDWNNDSFQDIDTLHVVGECRFSEYIRVLNMVRTRHYLNFKVKPINLPTNPGTIEIPNFGSEAFQISHGRLIKIHQLNTIEAHEISIWKVPFTDSEINTFLRNWRASEVPMNWKKLEILFDREADLEVVLEGIDATNEDHIKPEKYIHQWSFKRNNEEQCKVTYAEYATDDQDLGFAFHVGN